MAGSTPIYGFPYPESSDLVANYPALGQDLAEDIETVISGIKSGLQHINTTTFSAVSSVSINNVFTSSYDAYKYVIRITASTAPTSWQLNLRLRASGTDSTANDYRREAAYAFNNSIGGSNSTFTSSFIYNVSAASPTNAGDFFSETTLYGPNLATRKSGIYATSYTDSAGQAIAEQGALVQQSTTQFDGISLISSSGNITGTIRIYGLQNS